MRGEERDKMEEKRRGEIGEERERWKQREMGAKRWERQEKRETDGKVKE